MVLNCDICIEPKGIIRRYTTYQPTKENYEIHDVCEKCVQKLVEKYFSLVNVL